MGGRHGAGACDGRVGEGEGRGRRERGIGDGDDTARAGLYGSMEGEAVLQLASGKRF